MSFNVKIDGTSPKAQSIIKMLKEWADDYPFMSVSEDHEEINKNILREVDAQKEHMKEHPDDWRTWDEVKNNMRKP